MQRYWRSIFHSLADGDFDQIVSINNPTAGASDTDITSLSAGGYRTITLNATGRGWISKTGYTKLGLREGHDAVDSAPSDSTFTGVQIQTADFTGTSRDPYLEVTYTSNSSPTAPTSLKTEGLTNPLEVNDTTPEFSAIYNDPASGDIATHYRIQVSTTSAFASTTWDSSQTALASSTSAGSRIADVAFGGTPLSLAGQTY